MSLLCWPPEPETDPPSAPEALSTWTEVFGFVAPRPGQLGLCRWLPQAWDPGQECLERQRLEKFLRAEGWMLVSEVPVGEPVIGSFYFFSRVVPMPVR